MFFLNFSFSLFLALSHFLLNFSFFSEKIPEKFFSLYILIPLSLYFSHSFSPSLFSSFCWNFFLFLIIWQIISQTMQLINWMTYFFNELVASYTSYHKIVDHVVDHYSTMVPFAFVVNRHNLMVMLDKPYVHHT